MTPEGKVKQKAKPILKENDCWYFIPVSNGMGTHGIPDIVACVPVTITQEMVGDTVGLFLGVETKRDDVAELSKRQGVQKRKIQAASGLYVLVNMVRIPLFKKLIEKLRGV